MVRLPGLEGSESLSPPNSPLKSFPWIRFVEDIAREADCWFVHEVRRKKGGKGQEASWENNRGLIPELNPSPISVL